MGHLIGSIEVGKLADLVLWKPAFFGAKPEMVIKGGVIAWAQMGDPNASIPTPQPVFMRPMFGSFGKATGPYSIAFVSQLCKTKNVAKNYGLTKRIEAVKGCRKISKRDLKWNNALPKITVDPETYEVRADGELLTCEPAKAAEQRRRSIFYFENKTESKSKNPKETERNPKAEEPKGIHSEFEFRLCFGFRISAFGFSPVAVGGFRVSHWRLRTFVGP